MKKRAYIFFVLTVIMCLGFNGCSSVSKDSNPSDKKEWDKLTKPFLSIGSDKIQWKSLMDPTESVQNAEQETRIYNEFLKSDEWRKVNFGEGEFIDKEAKIKSKKIFDFDGDGVRELWIKASHDLSEISVFCTISEEKVQILLSGYISGGTIGGDRVVFGYDKKAWRQVVGLSGYAGGFSGRLDWIEYYFYENGELHKCISYSKMSQVEGNYSKEELEGLHYVEKENPFESTGAGEYISIYEVNEEQVSKKRFRETECNYEIYSGPNSASLTGKEKKSIRSRIDSHVKTVKDSLNFERYQDHYDGDVLVYRYFDQGSEAEENFVGYDLYYDARGKLIYADVGHYRNAHYSIYFYNDELLCTEPKTLSKYARKKFLPKDVSLCLEHAYKNH